MITLWYFTGDSQNRYFELKLSAETAARLEFPDEPANKRYARIYFREFFSAEDIDKTVCR